jgi:hypothetical protein
MRPWRPKSTAIAALGSIQLSHCDTLPVAIYSLAWVTVVKFRPVFDVRSLPVGETAYAILLD